MNNLLVIDTGLFKLDGGAMFGVVPKSIWNKVNPADDNNMCTWAMRCLLIQSDEKIILIDTGIGNKQGDDFFNHFYLHGNDTLLKSLASNGFSTDQITDVFLTHLHFDHVGGAVSKNENQELNLTFPNATYWVSESQWKNAIHPNHREKASYLHENIFPLEKSGKLKFLPAKSPFTEFDYIEVNGHTSGMLLPLIHFEGQKILYAADLFPSVGHIPLPYIMSYDTQPLLTLREKEEILALILKNEYIIFFEHDPTIECCNLKMTEKGIRVNQTGKLNELLKK